MFSCLTWPSREFRFQPTFRDNEYFNVGVCHDDDDRVDEDCCAVQLQFLGEEATAFFGFYEGHRSGWTVARAASLYLHELLATEIYSRERPVDIKDCFEKAFSKLDESVKNNAYDRGACATTCMIREYKDRTMLHFANIGDTRAILSREGKSFRLTYNHTHRDEEEAARLAACRAYIKSNPRVRRLVTQTRAFGDHAFKKWVISTPYYNEILLTQDDTWLLLLSNNICQTLDDQDAVNIAEGENLACQYIHYSIMMNAERTSPRPH